MKKSWVFHWTEINGRVTTLELNDCSADEAVKEATAFGWKPPRWWEWWRRFDYPQDAGEQK